MSFILDALRKSENERQQQGQAEFAAVPSGSRESSTPRWLWVVGLLLAVNLAVLAGLLMRPDVSPPTQQSPVSTPVPEPELTAEPTTEPTFRDRVAAAQRDIPQQETIEPATRTERESNTVEPVLITQDPTSIDASQIYPTLQEVAAAGRVALPPLHLDIHVYSDAPADRFVFINMSKYREGSRIDEGPLVNEITPDGAVLEYQGATFLLTRE